MSKHKVIEIVDKLSSESYLHIEKFLGMEINTILLSQKPNSAFLSNEISQVTFQCDSISLLNHDFINNKIKGIVVTQDFKHKDSRSAYSTLQVEHELEKDYEEYSHNTGNSFLVRPPKGLLFENAEIYGVSCVNELLDYDEYFPDEKTFISNDSDCMVKLNTKTSKFLVLLAKEGSMFFTLGHTSKTFDKYLSMTQRGWGEHSGYKYKYSIK